MKNVYLIQICNVTWSSESTNVRQEAIKNQKPHAIILFEWPWNISQHYTNPETINKTVYRVRWYAYDSEKDTCEQKTMNRSVSSQRNGSQRQRDPKNNKAFENMVFWTEKQLKQISFSLEMRGKRQE